jgi:predicted ferric reductase
VNENPAGRTTSAPARPAFARSTFARSTWMWPILAWTMLAAATLIPLWLAATSPLQASRDAYWVSGAIAGVVALALMLAQPLLAAGDVMGSSIPKTRRWHRWAGAVVVAAVAWHVIGLYISSPEDVADALLLVAPTPFSVYGVIGLVAVLLTAVLVALRSKSGLRYGIWRAVHNGLALVFVIASVVHAMLIEGAMNQTSKIILCGLVLAATILVLARVHVLKRLARRR